MAGPADVAVRLARDGFAFVRRLVPVDEVLAVRRAILELCFAHGWIREGTTPADGIAAASVDDIEPAYGVGITAKAYAALQRLESFHVLGHHPAILALMSQIFDETPLVHAQKIARVMLPSAANAPTPPHQDYVFIQGTEAVYTCWLPLGDCPRELGALSLLAESHRDGVLPMTVAAGAGKRRSLLPDRADREPWQWYDRDLNAGDAIVFNSLCVHRSLPNRTDRIRLSVDYRYQSTRDPIAVDALRPHGDVLPWEEIYAGWHDRRLQYYWRGLVLNLVELDRSLLEVGTLGGLE